MALFPFLKNVLSKDDDATASAPVVVHMSSSGQLSIDVADLARTPRFQKNLELTKKIAALAAKG